MLPFTLALLAAIHDPGLSSSVVRREGSDVVAVVTFNRKELAAVAAPDDPVAVRDLFAAGYELRVDGKPVPLAECTASFVAPVDTEITLRFAKVGDGSIELALPLFAKLDPAHRHHVAALANGKVVPLGLLDRAKPRIAVAFGSAVNAGTRFAAFLELGIEHVLTGYDHVLFLLALLLVGLPWLTTLGVITAFTVSHSLTLGLAALEVLSPKTTLVEPLIAATIVYVGLENLFVKEHRHRWLVAAVFGLVHGFGFAAVLRELAIGSGAEAVPVLLAFNLGVEIGQAAIAAIAVPLLFFVHRHPGCRRKVVVIGSIAICALGLWWLVERTILAQP